MGTIKIEFDLPDFREELQVNIVIHKDGEVVCKTTTSPNIKKVDDLEKNLETEKLIKVSEVNLGEEKKPTSRTKKADVNNENSSTSPKKKLGGNMMNQDF